MLDAQDQQALLTATLHHDEITTLELIKQGADPHVVDENGRSPLHHAAKRGHGAVVQALIKANANLNLKDAAGVTPLMLGASSDPQARIGLILLQKGANPHQTNNRGRSPLHYACHYGDKILIAALLERGVDIDQVNNEGITPLMVAAFSPKGEEAALTLLKTGADLNQVDQDGESALHLAAWSGHKTLITALLERGVDIDQANREGETPLMFAACSANGEEAALMLLKAGADPKKIDHFGNSVLHIAGGSGHRALITALLKQGADPHVVDDNGRSPLHHAAKRGHSAVVQALIKANANLNLKDAAGVTPLMLGASSDPQARIGLILLQKGANPHQTNCRGRSPLHYACHYGDKILIAALLERGVDIDQVNNEGMTPLMVAAFSPKGEEAALTLLKTGADLNQVDQDGESALHLAAWSGHKTLITALLEQDLDIDQANYRGKTPLIIAANSPNGEEAALMLLEAGADPRQVDMDHNSVLNRAYHSGHKAFVIALLKRGVDIPQASNQERTPLMAAANSPTGEQAALALLESGADPSEVDHVGNSALHQAGDSGHKALIAALLKRGVDIDPANALGLTPLMVAANSPTGEQAALTLLEAGADPEKVDHAGCSALWRACNRGHHALINALLKRDVDIEQGGIEGKTPLMAAADSPMGEEAALMLLKAGADPRKVDENGDSALHLAGGSGHTAFITALLEHDVDIEQRGSLGRTPLMTAANSPMGEEAALTLLKAGADPRIVDQDGDSVLHYACLQERKALITALLEQDVDVNQSNSYGMTPLLIAAYLPNSEEAALTLLKAGADPRIVDQDNDSALHLAAHSGHTALVTALLERGVDIEQANCDTRTPLMDAAFSPNGEEAALILLKAGADPKKVEGDGDSALHLACRMGHTAVVTALLKRGVDIDQVNGKEMTPLMLAAFSKNGQEAALTLLKAGADPRKVDQNNDSALHLAGYSGHTALVTALLERGVDVDQIDGKGWTPLMLAVFSKNGQETALTLLEAGADPKKVDQDGESALHLAGYSGHTARVTALLERGVDIEQANSQGQTPLMVAANSPTGEQAALTLLEAGADPTKTDNQGRSAAHFAEEEGHTELLQALAKWDQDHNHNDR